jgi:hypothetical protein
VTITAGTLIRDAYLLASVLDLSEEPEGFYATQGLLTLNDVITQWGNIGIYIPYDSVYQITVQPGVATYTTRKVIVNISEGNIVTPNSSTTNSNLITPLKLATLKERNLFNNNYQGRPNLIYLERQQVILNNDQNSEGSQYTLYPTPDSSYNLTLYLKWQLKFVSLFEQLVQFPDYYLKPLKYQLAKDFSDLYKTVLPPQFFEEYNRLMQELKATNPSDMTIQNSNPFLERRPFRPRSYYVL